eukprot:m.133910 g.133910  ORF g.133910 m.133910 type:complete len:82 (+) comp15962_c0_seq1:2203-2448(+)
MLFICPGMGGCMDTTRGGIELFGAAILGSILGLSELLKISLENYPRAQMQLCCVPIVQKQAPGLRLESGMRPFNWRERLGG